MSEVYLLVDSSGNGTVKRKPWRDSNLEACLFDLSEGVSERYHDKARDTKIRDRH